MTTANPFILCNLAAKYARASYRKSIGNRFEEYLHENIRTAEEYLLSGTKEEVEVKNLRHPCAKVWENECQTKPAPKQ